MSGKNILFFNGRLLAPSETFIRAQGEGLERYVPYYVGSKRVEGLPLPEDRTLVVNKGGPLGLVNEFVFKQYGIAPGFYKDLTRLKPTFLHAHFGVCGALALPIVCNLKIPMILTAYGIDVTMKDELARKASLSHRVYFQRLEQLKQKSCMIIAISEFIKSKLLEKGFPEEKIVIHRIGVDTQIFQHDPSIERKPVVLFVGRLVEKKGCEYLIRAMAKVQASRPDIELVLIGDGPLRNNLESLADDQLKQYRFLGIQPPEMVKKWMSQATIFSVPSITAESGDTEGLGVVFAEAQAMGTPVVSSFSGGIPEVVSDGNTGFLAAEKDWEGLARHISTLLEDPELWQRFSIAGQQRIQKMYDQTQLCREQEDIYDSVVAQYVS